MARTRSNGHRKTTKKEIGDDKRPDFFKIYFRKLSSQRLLIPPLFVKNFMRRIPNKITLRDHNGNCSEAGVAELESGLCIVNGWQGFVEDHSIEQGDFMMFTYDNRELVFDVKIYGKHACNKDAIATDTDDDGHDEPSAPTKPGVKVKIEEEDMGASEQPPSRLAPRKRPSSKNASNRKRKRSNQRNYTGINSFNTKKIDKRYREARRLFELEDLELPQNPYFLGSFASRYTMHIPKYAVIENGITLKDKIFIRKQNGEDWPVLVAVRPNGRILLSSGWFKFTKDNNLEKKDRVVFEFILSSKRVCEELRPHIFRAPATKIKRRSGRLAKLQRQLIVLPA